MICIFSNIAHPIKYLRVAPQTLLHIMNHNIPSVNCRCVCFAGLLSTRLAQDGSIAIKQKHSLSARPQAIRTRTASAKKTRKQRPQSAKKLVRASSVDEQRSRPVSASSSSSRSSKSSISVSKRPYSASGSIGRNS